MTYTDTLEEFHWAMRLCAILNGDKKPHPLNEYTNTLRYLLEYGHSPETVWEFLDSGSYKEVYVPFHKAPFVLKFCSSENDTAAEEEVISEASSRGLRRFFVPTYFIKLPTSLPAVYLEAVWSYSGSSSATWSESEARDQELDYLEVQPRIRVYQEPPYVNQQYDDECWAEVVWGEDCNCEPVDPDIADRLRRFIPYADFAARLYQYYPNKLIEELVLFMEEFGISDLHGTNLGFMKEDGRPVILDWMSR